jgi:hypothetical protein
MSLPLPIDPRRWSRETRLLVVTIVLSLAVLLMLARFRFPAQELALPVQPLQQLAARAAFDDLGTSVTRATARVRPSVLVVGRAPAAAIARSVSLEDVLRQDGAEPPVDYVLALRFRPDLALVLSGGRPLTLRPADARVLSVRGHDALKGLTVLRVPPPPEEWQPLAMAGAAGPQYLLVAEAVAGGLAMRPLFGGQAGRLASPHWDGPLIALGQPVQAASGALVFALDGALVGGVVRAGSAGAIVPADVLLAAAARVAERPPRVPATIGVHLQALDAALAAATNADYGVAVSAVDPDGPAADVLQPGDVITAVADRPAGTPENALLLIAALDVLKPSALQVLRSGRPLAVSITPRSLGDGGQPRTGDALGLTLRQSPRGATIVDVERRSAADRAGLVAGDVITSIDGGVGVTPARVVRAYAALAPGAHVVLGVDRSGAPVLIALRRAVP